MGVHNSLPMTITRQRRGCDLNPGPSATEPPREDEGRSERDRKVKGGEWIGDGRGRRGRGGKATTWKLCEVTSVCRWSGGGCKDTTWTGARPRRTDHDDPVTFSDVSPLFLVVAAVVLGVTSALTLCVVTTRRQPRQSNDQASSVRVAQGAFTPSAGGCLRHRALSCVMC